MGTDDGQDPIDPALLEAELARPLEPALREAGAIILPPADFAERVFAARAALVERPAASTRRPGLLALASAALIIGGFIALRTLGGDSDGRAQPRERASLALGGRAVAVAEAESELAWHVTRSSAEIEQRAGNVFYRVEHGGRFVVHTPAGDVEVLGTCFRVEVGAMRIGKQGLVGAGFGAAIAATVVVSVYEGRVSYANEHGKVAIAAGESATAARGSAPVTLGVSVRQAIVAAPSGPAAETLSREELLQRAAAQQREIAGLRARVQGMEASGAAGASGAAANNADSHKYINPSKEELEALAKECRLNWDEPKLGISPSTVDAAQAGELGLSEPERQAMNKVNADFNTKTIADLRQLYVEVTGDSQGADALTPGSLIEELEQKSPRSEVQAAFQRVSRERAGLQPVPADLRALPPIDRLMRLRTSLGDRYEKELGAAIGPDLAHQLREKNGGWGSKHGSSYGCPDSSR